jgi:hypothetical protein
MDDSLTAATAALVTLAEKGIPTDIQELLVYGNPERGIAPGALSAAIKAVLPAAPFDAMKSYQEFRESYVQSGVKLTASLIVRRYLEKLRSHPGFPERKYPPEYYADELTNEIATALTAAIETANVKAVNTAGIQHRLGE